ncbi:hypothetical protein M427DRAFT_34833 [Gonapodya prolifera JEL478]|uniref:Secreted protein n=1 Tax=Gonapodya prolifera (strain JEL478) TaxID=1344416 RepID=A0A139A644_GONPJ|nr:hypothetical protein M427DRAFT_34833 [Gonapodya prolifera JEL478]|eukprot:KXS12267.1 hypothetical protein M427DRAFT_34833 [Gonapodya prolifera JEL478]
MKVSFALILAICFMILGLAYARPVPFVTSADEGDVVDLARKSHVVGSTAGGNIELAQQSGPNLVVSADEGDIVGSTASVNVELEQRSNPNQHSHCCN